jgi:hypothetical protein
MSEILTLFSFVEYRLSSLTITVNGLLISIISAVSLLFKNLYSI